MARAVQVVPAGSVPRLLVVVVPEVTMMVAALSRVDMVDLQSSGLHLLPPGGGAARSAV